MIETAPIIDAVGLKKYYERGSETVKALDGVDFQIRAGEVVSIVGPSGSGKTTLMNLISCLDAPTDGTLQIAGTDVGRLKESRLIEVRRNHIGFVFQQFYLIPTLTVRENITLPLVFSRMDEEADRVDWVMRMVGLEGKDRLRIDQLSGGDKQRVSIARALVNQPQILIADEPTGKLENEVRDCIIDLFLKLAEDGLAVFIATHDLVVAARTRRIIHLQDGKIVPRESSSLYFA